MRSKRSLRQLSEGEARPTRSSRTSNPSYTIPNSDEDERPSRRPSRPEYTNGRDGPKSSPDPSYDQKVSSSSSRITRNSREVRDSLSNVGSSEKNSKKSQKMVESDQEDNSEVSSKKYPQKKEKSSSQSDIDEDIHQEKKYSFRNRERHHRTQLNVSHLGGKDQTYEPLDLESDSRNNSDSDESKNGQVKSNLKRDNRIEDIEDNEEEDDDENDSPRRKYSFRDRSRHRRETLNVTHLGGEGQSYLKKKPHGSNNSGGFTYRDTTRLYLGGRLPNYKVEGSHHPKEKRRFVRRTHYDSSSESSSSSSCSPERKRYRNKENAHDEEIHFREHEEERLRKEMASIVPLTLNQKGSNGIVSGMGGSMRDHYSKKDLTRADVNPLAVDSSIGFASVGGLDSHINALKEMVVLPLLYPDVFERFDTQPPRGVLFVGPPGTGKTLTARALANSLSTAGGTNSGIIGGRKVSFFMRKGADCLSKWVGEGERQLRLLFEQAKLYQPSIIFFDEIDGLAPVRSIKQDQIHASIVSTLLALMDGLDSRGQVVIIGATNRPDAIDPALRRPGRFDRELLFPLPDANARRAILNIHTASWKPPLEEALKEWIIECSSGYCGADLKALCSEAAIISLRRAYPQVYQSNSRLVIDPTKIQITRGDFAAALTRVIPSSRRAASSNLPTSNETITKPLVQRHIDSALAKVRQLFAHVETTKNIDQSLGYLDTSKGYEEEWIAALTDAQGSCLPSGHTTWDCAFVSSKSRIMISGERGMLHSDVAAAVLQNLESLQIFNLDITSLISDGTYFSPDQALISKVMEAKRAAPSIIYLPDIFGWFQTATESMKTILITLIDSVPISIPILWLGTLILSPQVEEDHDDKLAYLLKWFTGESLGEEKHVSNLIHSLSSFPNVVHLGPPSREERLTFFSQFFHSLPTLPNAFYAARKSFFEVRNQKLAIDQTTPSQSSDTVVKVQEPPVVVSAVPIDNERDENYFREQRLFFWTALSELRREKKFSSLVRPVDPELVPDYYDVITSPMDLETMRSKVDADLYPTFQSFLFDFEQIVFNAKEYNPLDARDARGRSIVSAAHHMLDVVKTHAYAFKERLGYDVFKRCDEIYFRKHGHFPILPQNRQLMPEENKIYYREILQKHFELKKELEEERKQAKKKLTEEESDDDTLQDHSADSKNISQRRTQNTNKEERDTYVELDEKALRKKMKQFKSQLKQSIEASERDTVSLTKDEKKVSYAVEVEPEAVRSKVSDESPLVQQPLLEVENYFQPDQRYDITKCQLINSYQHSIELSLEMKKDGLFERLLEQLLDRTVDWKISDLVIIYTNLKRFTRDFRLQGNWVKMMQDIQNMIENCQIR